MDIETAMDETPNLLKCKKTQRAAAVAQRAVRRCTWPRSCDDSDGACAAHQKNVEHERQILDQTVEGSNSSFPSLVKRSLRWRKSRAVGATTPSMLLRDQGL